MCFARLAIWACTAACSVFGGEALVPSKFASEDFLGSSEPTSPWLMLWAGDVIFSSAPSAILCWTQLILQVLLMWKLWRNGADGCIAFSFLPSGFQPIILGSHYGKDQGFSQEYLTLEDKLFSSLPITSAKKCWKSKWKIKTHEARNSFCDLCLVMVIYQKSSEVSFPLFFGKGSSWQLNIDFSVLV